MVEDRLDFAPVASALLPPVLNGRLASVKQRRKSLMCLNDFGAGEGIRTLDPNLGKVVLYL